MSKEYSFFINLSNDISQPLIEIKGKEIHIKAKNILQIQNFFEETSKKYESLKQKAKELELAIIKAQESKNNIKKSKKETPIKKPNETEDLDQKMKTFGHSIIQELPKVKIVTSNSAPMDLKESRLKVKTKIELFANLSKQHRKFSFDKCKLNIDEVKSIIENLNKNKHLTFLDLDCK